MGSISNCRGSWALGTACGIYQAPPSLSAGPAHRGLDCTDRPLRSSQPIGRNAPGRQACVLGYADALPFPATHSPARRENTREVRLGTAAHGNAL